MNAPNRFDVSCRLTIPLVHAGTMVTNRRIVDGVSWADRGKTVFASAPLAFVICWGRGPAPHLSRGCEHTNGINDSIRTTVISAKNWLPRPAPARRLSYLPWPSTTPRTNSISLSSS